MERKFAFSDLCFGQKSRFFSVYQNVTRRDVTQSNVTSPQVIEVALGYIWWTEIYYYFTTHTTPHPQYLIL